MNYKELKDILQLHTISRWQIVETTRCQSVAEHSFRVWALVQHLYDHLFYTAHNSMERDAVSKLALVHDLPELVTGDIPTTVKKEINKLAPQVMSKLEMAIMQREFPTVYSSIMGMQNTMGWHLFKVADCVEAILWIQQYGIYKAGARGCSHDVVIALIADLEGIFQHLEDKYPSSADWNMARRWVEEIIDTTFIGQLPDEPPPPQEVPSPTDRPRD